MMDNVQVQKGRERWWTRYLAQQNVRKVLKNDSGNGLGHIGGGFKA